MANFFKGIAGIWSLYALFHMTNATYQALDTLFDPALSLYTLPLFILICGALCLTPIGWAIALYWLIFENRWEFLQVLQVYGAFIFIAVIFAVESIFKKTRSALGEGKMVKDEKNDE